jgi:hypothetical protein
MTDAEYLQAAKADYMAAARRIAQYAAEGERTRRDRSPEVSS